MVAAISLTNEITESVLPRPYYLLIQVSDYGGE